MYAYKFRPLDERKKIQEAYEKGASVRELAKIFNLSPNAMHVELKRGYRDDVLLPDARRMYDAELAQTRTKQGLSQRGGRKVKVPATDVGAAE